MSNCLIPVFVQKIYIEYLTCAWHFVRVEDKGVDRIKFFSSTSSGRNLKKN